MLPYPKRIVAYKHKFICAQLRLEKASAVAINNKHANVDRLCVNTNVFSIFLISLNILLPVVGTSFTST